MQKDECNLLEVPKFELKFFKDGGHGRTPLSQKQHPKCANPACPTAFHWMAGGKFFRSRAYLVRPDSKEATHDLPAGVHGVMHYWLCECCSHVFTLVYDPQYGVVLKVLCPEPQESADSYKKASAA